VPQLTSQVLSGTDFGPSGGDGRTDHDLDTFGHGTAMASIMVASPGPFGIEGLSPGAKILPIAVPLEGTDDASDDDHLAAAIRYAADHGAKIINMSLGATRTPAAQPDPCDPGEQAAIAYAGSKGAILVAADGNGAMTGNPTEDPGVCVGVVTVAAVDSTGTVASFSSQHPYITLAAPGVNIPSLGRIPGKAFHGEGTSQSTAITSAAIALVWSKYPALTNKQVLARVLATLDSPHATRDPGIGFGIINPESAITATVPADAPEPILSALDPYIAEAEALSAPRASAPRAAATQPQPPGSFAVGGPPSRLTSTVVSEAVVALVGLLSLLILLRVGWVRRRSLYEDEAHVAAQLTPSPVVPGPDGWREVVPGPEQWLPPPRI
jgi:subtilisin family serine protease